MYSIKKMIIYTCIDKRVILLNWTIHIPFQYIYIYRIENLILQNKKLIQLQGN